MKFLPLCLCPVLASTALLIAQPAAYDPLKVADVKIISKTYDVTAFWDAQLKGDAQAKAWLNGAGAKSVLAPEDKWEMNAMARGVP